MSTTTSEAPSVEPPADSAQENVGATGPSNIQTEVVAVQRLITNRPITFPIHDTDGVLLLAEGSLLTTKFKELLRARNISEVLLHPGDIQTVTLAEHSVLEDAPHWGFDMELTAELDRVVESGSLFVANSGQALVDEVTRHDCKGYDREERDRIVEIHREAREALDACLQEVLRGKSVDGKKFLITTGQYLAAMMSDTDCVMSAVLEVDDPALSDHCLQMSLLGMAMGIEIGLDDENTRTLGLCGLLHDWGMVRVPQAIRQAKHVLSDAEFVAIKRHPIHVLEMLEKVTGISSTVPLAAYQVHERPDGSGYPRGRRQHETHIFARILGVADAYLALTSPRPYRPPLMPYAAMECLITLSSQGGFDPKIVKALLQIMSLFPIGSYVVLNDGSAARVLRRSGSEYGTPVVRIVTRPDGTKVPDDDESAIYNLAESTGLQVVQALPTPNKNQIGLSPEILKINRQPV